MKNKAVSIILSAVMAAALAAGMSGMAAAAEETPPEIAPGTQALDVIREVVEDAADDPLPQTAVPQAQDAMQADTVSGLYIADYAPSEGNVNLNLIFDSDLTAVSSLTDTQIYDFREGGKAVIYDRGVCEEGTFEISGPQLTIRREGRSDSCTCEFADGLLILHTGDRSQTLYPFALPEGVYLEDYSVIEIDEASVTITDGYVDSFIRSLLDGQTRTEEITEGVTNSGDIVTISFTGVLDGETEPFEGGSGENFSLELGSGTLIDNYEDQLTGQPIGSTVDVTVTFPEDYSGREDLRGKKATFRTTIHSKTLVTRPELTDAWVQEYTSMYFPQRLDTVEQFREYCRAYQSSNLLHTAIFQALAARMHNVEYRNTYLAQMLMNYASIHLNEAAAGYGMDAETFAQQMGYSSAQAYVQYEASSNIMSALLIDRILRDLGINYTEAELEAKLAEDVKLSYGDTMTVSDYRTQSGTLGMWAYTNLQYKYNLATTALENRVVLVPHEAQPAGPSE